MPTALAANSRGRPASDDAGIAHHSAFYRDLAPESLGRTVEIGAGPNLYPLFLASGAARRIDAVDRSAAGLGYLREQVAAGRQQLAQFDEGHPAFLQGTPQRQRERRPPATGVPAAPRLPAQVGGEAVAHCDTADLPIAP